MGRIETQNGILMPTLDSFYEMTRLALDVQPQKGLTFFMPGKGWGSEIAIRGQVVGRKKHTKYLHKIPYRSHSDFELYSVPKHFRYSSKFQELFGSQEWYGETQTKSFKYGHNIPMGYMKEGSETTILDGLSIQTLSLEFLMADKLVSEGYNFDKPNNHGRDISDSACIALLYDLDVDKIKEIINEFHIKPKNEELKAELSDEKFAVRGNHLIKCLNIQKQYAEDIDYTGFVRRNSQIFTEQGLRDLYNDESKWEDGKLKKEEADKIIQADAKIYKAGIDAKLEEYSQESIFKKIDNFFLTAKERRKEMDNEMGMVSQQMFEQKMQRGK